MISSMTGFGRGESQDEIKKFIVEIKSVNHRYSEIVIRMPKFYSSLEDRIRKVVQQKVARGRVDVFINFEEIGSKNKQVKVDKDLAVAYYNALGVLKETIGEDSKISVMNIAGFPDVIKIEEAEDDLEEIWQVLEKALVKAVSQLVEMRRVEGERLTKDLLGRVDTVDSINQEITKRSPIVVEEYRERLANRMKELLGDLNVDESRIANEVAFFADRCSITEENVRLKSHLEQVRESLKADESVGRKLDFLVQEINREINTIGSKANDLEISNKVIEAKSEVEKIREQVQNIE